MTPNDIEVLIHFYVSPEKHPRLDAGAVKNAVQFFLENDVVYRESEDIYRTTQKGEAWVKALCKVPCPKQAWIDENGNIVL